MRYVALLRGINVGGSRKVAMADLRQVLLSLGYTDVETYLQSGNALFTGPEGDPDATARAIEQGLMRDLGMEIRVLLRTREEMAAVIAGNPFPQALTTPSLLHVAFLSGPLDPKRLEYLDPQQYTPDDFQVGDRVIYLWYPEGSGRSKLATLLTPQRLGVAPTARNWNTVTKLLTLLGS